MKTMAASFSLWSNLTKISSVFSQRKIQIRFLHGESYTLHSPVMTRECLGFLSPKDDEVSLFFSKLIDNDLYDDHW